MKYLFVFLLLFLPSLLHAQCSAFDGLLKKGDVFLQSTDYQAAISAYTAALLACPDRANEAKIRIEKLVTAIDQLKNEKEKQKQIADNGLQKANKIVSTFYFAYDRFALAFKDREFYFIDKNGDKVDKLGAWEKAEQFGEYSNGFTKVGRMKEEYYLDTLGNSYRVAYALKDLSTEIKALDLTGTQLDSFPSEILAHSQLEILILNGNLLELNNFKTLPAEITNLDNLKYLSLSYCQLDRLPAQVEELKNLTWLMVSGNQLTALPVQIGELKNLNTLNLEENQLTILPPQIGELKNLTNLNLSENSYLDLVSVCNAFKYFPKKMMMSTDKFTLNNEASVLLINIPKQTTLPAQIGELKNLTSLYLGDSQLTTLPTQISELKNLTYLNLDGNQLTTLPAQIGELKNLESLSLYGNQLTTLPPQIGGLKNLTWLGLNKNQLTTLPPQIGELNNLTSLQLWSNQLVILPIQIVELKNLTELYLSGNQLTSLPAQIGELKNLISLYLGGNQLTSLPAQIAALKNLARLDLSNNQLTTLPAQIGELKKLTALYLDGNRLTALPPQIRELRKLEVLNLGYNNIEKVAVQIGDLKNLTELNLSQNRVLAAERKTILALLPDCEIVFAEDYSKMANRYHVNGDYAEAFKAQQKVVEKDGKNYSNWFTLSFYALFIGEPQKAIQAAKHVLALNPEAVDVETNLALGYLLNNQWAEAEAIYLKWKGKNFPDDNRLWDLVFLAEIADLEKTGIIHPDFEKVKKIFGK